MYRRIIVLLGILGVILSLGMGHYSVVTWNIVAVLVTASIGIPGLILAYEKVKSEESVRPQKDKTEIVVSSERETQKESLLPDSAKITELNIDDKMLDQIYEEAHRKALDIYDDAKLSRFIIQVYPFQKFGGYPNTNIYMDFYAKLADRICKFQYGGISHKLRHCTPDKRATANYDRKVFNTLPWKTHPHWRQFLRRAYEMIKPLPKEKNTAYYLSAYAYEQGHWTAKFNDEFSGNEYTIEWDGRGLDENSIKRIL